MPISVIIKNRWGYVIAFFLLLISYVLIFFVIKNLEEDAGSVSRSNSIIYILESINSAVTDAETGVRGYIITGDLAQLRPYNSGSRKAFELHEGLEKLISDEPEEDYRPLVDSLGKLLRHKMGELSAVLNNFQKDSQKFSVNTVYNDIDSGIMNQIRLVITTLEERENALMNVRNNKLQGFFKTMTITAIISLLITLVTIFYSLITYQRENVAREEADRKAGIYRAELEGRVKELNRLNTELNELRSIEKFAASGRIARTIAHEVRNPLTNISLASEQLKDSIGENEEPEMLLGMIDRSVNRINQLVSDLLTATRTEQLEFAPASINQILDQALLQAQDRIELKNIRVDKHYDEQNPKVVVDPEKIRLAFLNIVVNAIEAMPAETGLLELITRRQDHKCIIEFRDNGSGMDEDTRQKIFEPYFTSKSKGNGLGLTHTQNIIFQHKGQIQVDSQPGQGSLFTVILNIAEE